MTIKVDFIDNGTGVEIIASGLVTGKELLLAQKEIYNLDKLPKQRYHIIDKSLCTEYDVTATDIEKMSQFDQDAAQVNPNILMAIVESHTLQFSLSEVWQAYVEAFVQHSQSFKNRSDAERWISETLASQSDSIKSQKQSN